VGCFVKIIDDEQLQRLEELRGKGDWTSASEEDEILRALPLLLDSVRRLKEALAIAEHWMHNPDPGNGDYGREFGAAVQRIFELTEGE